MRCEEGEEEETHIHATSGHGTEKQNGKIKGRELDLASTLTTHVNGAERQLFNRLYFGFVSYEFRC
eukprot:704587-Amphidinium_carterae.1